MIAELVMASVFLVPPNPETEATLALKDLVTNVKPDDQKGTRYLTLYNIKETDRPSYVRTLLFWTNSISFRRQQVYFTVLGINEQGQLYQIPYDVQTWFVAENPKPENISEEVYQRYKKAADAQDALLLKARIIRMNYNDYLWPHEAWEELANADPYFFPKKNISIEVDAGLKELTNSVLCVVRADFFLYYSSVDDPYGNYHKWLGLEGKLESEINEKLGIRQDFLKKNFLLQGGALLQSNVAQHNRGLELVPTVFGQEESYLWRTYDVIDDPKNGSRADQDGKSVLLNLLGTLDLDGREAIYSLPNGMQGYYLSNKAGEIVPEAPTSLAQDKKDPHDAIVYNAYKCVSCHGPSKGIIPFDDVIRRMILSEDVGLAVISKYKKDERLRQELEDYYLSPLGQTIVRQQESYENAINKCNGYTSELNARLYVKRINTYLWSDLDLNTAAIEVGVDPKSAHAVFKRVGNQKILPLIIGEKISRLSWEEAYPEVSMSVILSSSAYSDKTKKFDFGTNTEESETQINNEDEEE